MRRALLASVFPLLFFSGSPLQAQSEVLSLDTIVVTVDRSAESLRKVSQNMDIITEKDIEKSAATEVIDILKQYGLQMNQQHSPGSTQESITIRGFSSSFHGNDLNSNVLILIDGRRAVGDSLSMQSLNNIARIEIIRGPGAMQYGSSAMGGVVNIITKRGGEQPHIRLEAGFGTWGQSKYSFFGSGQKDKLDFAAAASYLHINDFKDGDGLTHDNSGIDYKVSSMVNMGWNFNEFNRLGVSVQANRANDGGAEFATSTAGVRTNARIIDKNMSSLDFLYEGGTEGGDKSWLVRYYQGTSSYQIDYINAVDIRYKNSKSVNDFQGAQSQLSWNFDRVGLTGGLDWISYDLNQTQWAATALPNATNKGDYENIGAFLIAKVYLLEDKNMILTGGLRYDHYKVTMDNDVVGRNVVDGELTKKFDKALPSAGLAYSPVYFLKLRAHYGEAYKVPTPRELAGGFLMGKTLYHGNPDLDPAESKTWEAGFDFERYNLLVSGTYFRTRYENYIGVYQPAWGGTWDRVYENSGKATIDGMEWRVEYELGRQLDWVIDFTPYFNWTRLFTYETEDGKKLVSVAEDSLGFGAGFGYEPFGLTINLDGTYHGAQEIASFSTQKKSQRQGGATVWDLSAIKRLHSFDNDRGDLKLKVAAKNMFNKYYDTSDEIYMPGSSIYIGLIYDLK